jgi:hypothetical protein
MHHWHHLWFGQIKIATRTKCYVRVFHYFLLYSNTPLNFAMYETLAHSSNLLYDHYMRNEI